MIQLQLKIRPAHMLLSNREEPRNTTLSGNTLRKELAASPFISIQKHWRGSFSLLIKPQMFEHDQMGHFADCILKGARPPHGPEEGRDVLRIILQAAENAEGWQKTVTPK